MFREAYYVQAGLIMSIAQYLIFYNLLFTMYVFLLVFCAKLYREVSRI